MMPDKYDGYSKWFSFVFCTSFFIVGLLLVYIYTGGCIGNIRLYKNKERRLKTCPSYFSRIYNLGCSGYINYDDYQRLIDDR